MSRIHSIKKVDISTVTFPYNITLSSRVNKYVFTGSKTLSGDGAIAASGTPKNGMSVDIDWACTMGDSAYTITLFGYSIPVAYQNKRLKLHAEYDDSWKVWMLADISGLGGLPGSVMVIDSTGLVPLDIKAEGTILVGQGDHVDGKVLSGDVTMDNTGAVTIGANKILSAMIKAGELVNAHLAAAAGIVFTKMAALTASKIPVLNASGFIEASAIETSKLSYINVTTPGTAEADKAVVLDASKKISDIDITTLKLNGTTLTATAATLNAMDARITAGLSLVSHTEIVTDATPTAGTLQGSYTADTTAGAVYVFLPAANTVAKGTPVRILRMGGNDAGFKPSGTDKLYPNTSYTVDVASVVCSATGKSLLAIGNGVNSWQVVQKD